MGLAFEMALESVDRLRVQQAANGQHGATTYNNAGKDIVR